MTRDKCVLLGLMVVSLVVSEVANGQCDGDFNGDDVVTVDELVIGVGHALNGCPPPLPTSTATPTATWTPTSTASSTPTATPTATPTWTATPLPRCGDGLANPEEECDGSDLNDRTCLDVAGEPFGSLTCTAGCQLDTTRCSPVRFVDNLDGTITDHQTGLMWEKKCAVCGGLHDVQNRYPWQGACSVGNAPCRTDGDCAGEASCEAADDQGTDLTIFEWVEQLNGDEFAGQVDWQVPSIEELQTLRNLSTFDPAIDPIFHQAACADLTNPSCSRTRSSNHWSATTLVSDPESAWDVNFDEATVETGGKDGTSSVRAVRQAF